ncbi:MFS transporter [Candidatus Microgenomates bacterium]|nr:MAG: MFS transporter [Candidatus Microgenomates bacterium]
MEKNFSSQNAEKYIISESQEINIGESPGWTKKFFSAFPALKHKNYRYYFLGQLVSLIGTWLQMVAQGWLVLELTHSAFMLGLVSALGLLPTLFFSLFGGVIVDRFPKKKILIFTQTLFMVLAFILGVLTVLKVINVTEIVILAFLLGIITALDMPARQAFAVEMVGKEDLASAIALNSGIFNGARVVGPGIAGIIIAVLGTGGAFILNAVSYIAVIIALYFIKTKKEIPQIHPHPLTSIKEGIIYSFSNSTIKTLLLFTAITSIFGWSYSTIMPIIVQNIYHLGAESLGFFYSAAGVGALVGVVLVSSFAKKINNLTFILGGNFLFCISILSFTFTTDIHLALIFLFFAGLGLIAELSTINTTIQHSVKDHLRGRVMSIYTLMFLGLTPLGSFQVGLIAEHFGSQIAIGSGSVVMLFFGVILFLEKNKIQTKIG